MSSSVSPIPPHDIEAEQAVLGCALLYPKAASGVVTTLRGSDFYRPAHSRIFEAIASLLVQGAEVDHITVADRLQTQGRIEDAGGKPYLLDLTGAVATSAHWERYAAIVRRAARLRSLIAAGTEIVAMGYDSPDDEEETLARASSLVLSLHDLGSTSAETASQAVARRLDDYAQPLGAVMLPGTSTRLHFGDICVLGGRPGSGKTAMALQAADVWGKRYKVLVLSFEMSTAELADRLIARATKTTPEIAHAGLCESERAIYERACADLLGRESPQLRQAAGMSEARTVSTIRSFAASGGQVVILDYLQIASESRTNENADLTRFMRALQQVAKQTGICLLLLSQFSRSATDGRPGLHHLRSSGAIEQEAATVGLLWSPDSEDQRGRKDELATRGYSLDSRDPRMFVRLQWSKVRHGKIGVDYFLFDGAAMHLEPVERRG